MPMFEGGKSTKQSQETIVGADVILTGNVKMTGNIRVDGKINGKVNTENDILIGETAVIEGTLKAKNIVVTGTVKGNLETKEDLEIAPSGKIFGDLVTKNLIIKKGAIFIGKSTMPGEEGAKIEPVLETEEKTKQSGKTEKK